MDAARCADLGGFRGRVARACCWNARNAGRYVRLQWFIVLAVYSG